MADQGQPSVVCQLPLDKVGGETRWSTTCLSQGKKESVRNKCSNRQGQRNVNEGLEMCEHDKQKRDSSQNIWWKAHSGTWWRRMCLKGRSRCKGMLKKKQTYILKNWTYVARQKYNNDGVFMFSKNHRNSSGSPGCWWCRQMPSLIHSLLHKVSTRVSTRWKDYSSNCLIVMSDLFF